MTQPANDNRPAEFDALMVAYTPGLYQTARTRYHWHETEDLVQSTLAWALAEWRKYRAGRSPMPWLAGGMANIVTERKVARDWDAANVERVEADALSPPAQEHTTELRQVIGLLGPRDRDVMARVAIGCTLQDIGRAQSVSIERARQLVGRARERLQVACGERRAA